MRVFIILLFLAITTESIGQGYSNAIGLRGGIGSGLTFKHSLGSDTNFEGIVYARGNVANVTGLFEIYQAVPNLGNGFFFYYGAGAHIGSYTYKIDQRNQTNTTIGVDGILGLEYVFSSVPFNASLDWKPEWNFYGYNGFYWDGIALSVRYYW